MTVPKAEHDRIVQACLTEVNHRANNLLAVIQGIIRMSTADNTEDYKKVIEGRISALAQAHSLLSASNWESISLKDIIHGELVNYVDPKSSRLNIEGCEVMLPGPRAQNAAMIMHELATNAANYGALRTDHGAVTVKWEPADDGIHYCWLETGQDNIEEPEHFGTGLRMVSRIVASTRATMKISWPITGVHFEFFQPYDTVHTREAVMAHYL